jgi:hypothetical protein
MTTLEAGGAALGATFAIAQIAPDQQGLVASVLKGGSVAIVGTLFYLFMKQHKEVIAEQAREHKEAVATLAEQHKDAVDRIEKAHVESASRFDNTIDQVVKSMERSTGSIDAMVKHCSSTIAKR